jgi:hypothetical protein
MSFICQINFVFFYKQKSTIKSDYNVHLEYFFFFFQWSSSLSDPEYYRTCDMYIRRPGGMWLKTITAETRYDYNLTIMKSPKPATDNRFKK